MLQRDLMFTVIAALEDRITTCNNETEAECLIGIANATATHATALSFTGSDKWYGPNATAILWRACSREWDNMDGTKGA